MMKFSKTKGFIDSFSYFCTMCSYRKWSVVLRPITGELPFMIVFLMLMGIKWTRQLRLLVIHHDPEVTTFDVVGQLAFLFLIAYLAAAIIHAVNRKWFRILGYAVLIALFGIEMFLEKNFEMTISPSTLILLAETNQREIENFMSMYFFSSASVKTYLWIIAAVVLAMLLEWLYRKKNIHEMVRRALDKREWLVFPILAWLLFGVYSGKSLVNMLSADNTDEYYINYLWEDVHPEDPISELLRGLYGVHLAKKEMQRAVEVTENRRKDASLSFNDTVQVVLVIGESFNKWHSPLYGYQHNTTPCMVQERDSGQLFVFNDVLSPFNQTSPVMKNMLCCNSLAHNEPWSEMPYFPAIIRQVGYNVLFWDNQKDLGQGHISSFALNSFLYDPKMVDMCYTDVNENRFEYDGMLIDDFQKRYNILNERNFIIFHLYGQHFDAANMFPHEQQFMPFTADSIHRQDSFITAHMRERIATYDNATYYNDHNMGRLFEMFRNQNAVLVYLSDHGEEVFDYRSFEGRDAPNDRAEGDRLKYQFSVPFMVWCSKKYQLNHPEIVEEIKKATERPFLIDNLCHLIFHIAGVSTSYYNANRDILSTSFEPTKRIDIAKY